MNWFLFSGIAVFLLLIGFFTGLETAFASMNRFSVELKKKQGLASGRILSAFAEQPGRFIGATLVGLTLSLVMYGLLVHGIIDPLWKKLPSVLQGKYLRLFLELSVTTLIVLLTAFSFMAFFRARSNSLLSFFARSIHFIYSLYAPVASVFVGISEWILKYLFDVRIQVR